MNALHPEARGRTKADIGEIRHLYLELDHDAETSLHALNNRPNVPRGNHILNTSPGKLQVVWKIRDFSPEQAEGLQRQLAREVGADPAATDATRVLRLPGFRNHKYDPPHMVGLRTHHGETHSPADFPEIEERGRLEQRAAAQTSSKSHRPGELSQSEHDWADAKRRLWSGERPESVADSIAESRKDDKPNPRYYAERTVWRAANLSPPKPAANEKASNDDDKASFDGGNGGATSRPSRSSAGPSPPSR